MSTILITGGSGLIGSALTAHLRQGGHEVRWLGRAVAGSDGVAGFAWHPRLGAPDEAVRDVEHVVHLAGAPIADKRWSKDRVRELTTSRTAGPEALWQAAQRTGWRPRSFVSASGSGWYGAGRWNTPLAEEAPSGKDVIAGITTAWEAAADRWSPHARVVKLRTPIVLARTGGALPRLVRLARLGLAATLGDGRQVMTWVHLNDLVSAYSAALFNTDLRGAYNVAAPEQPDSRTFIRTLTHVLHRPFVMPAVPGIALRVALGGIADVLLGGGPMRTERLEATGWRCAHPGLEAALRDLLR